MLFCYIIYAYFVSNMFILFVTLRRVCGSGRSGSLRKRSQQKGQLLLPSCSALIYAILDVEKFNINQFVVLLNHKQKQKLFFILFDKFRGRYQISVIYLLYL